MSLKLPDIATGRVIPRSVQKQIRNEEEERRWRKQQYRHDWGIAIFSFITGIITAKIDVIFSWITKIISSIAT